MKPETKSRPGSGTPVNPSQKGELAVVATPIGNMGDLSPRAVEVLRAADAICCEDTRRTGLLLSRSGIRPNRLISLHEHNEASRTAEVLDLVAKGAHVAVVTDAGTPGVSDPGIRIVAGAHEAGLPVTAVPGPSAVAAAVSVAGMGSGRWRFEGFLPKGGGQRAERLAEIAESPDPVVVYEAPPRVDRLISDLAIACGSEREIVVCRELTKLHEEIWRGSLGDGVGRWPSATAKGEFVAVVDGRADEPAVPPEPSQLAGLVGELVSAGVSRRDAVAEVAAGLGIARRLVYDAATARRKRS